MRPSSRCGDLTPPEPSAWSAGDTDDQDAALFGPGGAVDPTTGERLVSIRRPGMELVVAAHKSVAGPRIIGGAEDIHGIMDAKRDATLAYLDSVARQAGRARGRAAVALPPIAGLT